MKPIDITGWKIAGAIVGGILASRHSDRLRAPVFSEVWTSAFIEAAMQFGIIYGVFWLIGMARATKP